MSRKQIFFTYNGRFLGNAFSNVEIEKDSLYASVCLQSVNEEISVNFGKLEQFVFDLEGFQLDIAQQEFVDISKQKIDRAGIFEVVKSYLVHYAYVETL